MGQRAKKKSWSYSAGERGLNRVRVYERPGHGIWVDYSAEGGKRVRQPLGHDDRDRAKGKADEIALGFRSEAKRAPQLLTLQTLFDIYEREVTPTKSRTAQSHDRRAMEMLLRALGGTRRPDTLSRRDWDSYIGQRRRGAIAPLGGEIGVSVGDRVVEQDCNLLLAILNWATQARDERGGYFLDRNPVKGLPVPQELSPARPILTPEQYQCIRAAAKERAAWLECFVVMAWYTGHRAASIRQLKWTDVDLEAGVIRWRGDVDKIGYEHQNPLHPESLAALKREQVRAGVVCGDGWIFPSGRDPSLPRSGNAMSNLWVRLAERANIPEGKRYGWHSCRRAFANELRDVSLRDLKDLGGWKSERTVVQVYLQPSEPAQRAALHRRSGEGTAPVVEAVERLTEAK